MRLSLVPVAAILLAPTPAVAQPGIPRTSPPAPSSEVFLIPLTGRGSTLAAGAPRNITNRAGYDNQPSFSSDGRSVYYTSTREDAQADIYRFDIAAGRTSRVTRTAPESEYSAAITRDGNALHVIRVEADSTQRIWTVPLDGSAGQVVFPDTKPVGYFAQPNDSAWVMFVLGTPVTMQLGYHGRGRTDVVGRNIGRSLHRIPGTNHASVVQKGSAPWQVMEFDPDRKTFTPLIALPAGSEDVAWADGNTLLVGSGSKLLRWTRGTTSWQEVADYASAGLKSITRLAISPTGNMLALVAEPR
jgi:dipeptidyl aminopeptidase/acylaminoacyl peptidase